MLVSIPFCQTGEDGGLLSTSHLRETEMPSLNGNPNPGVRIIAKDGVTVNRKKKKLLVLTLIIRLKICWKKIEVEREFILKVKHFILHSTLVCIFPEMYFKKL